MSWTRQIDRSTRAFEHRLDHEIGTSWTGEGLVRRAVDLHRADLATCLDLCESPIERPMLEALATVAHAWFDWVWIAKPGEAVERTAYVDELVITPQVPIGPYRVDFLLAADLDYGGKSRGRRRLVVECDGHDYHERTKEQAQRDRERDRYLQREGLLVYRFTGSEIWSDVFGCAQHAVEDLHDTVLHALPWPPDDAKAA